MARRFRNWCFTLNNYNEEEFAILEEATDDEVNGVVKYIIFQEEIGEEGTPHLQGYMETKSISLRNLKNKLGLARLHLERRRGRQIDAIEYARKEETRAPGGRQVEKGTMARARGRQPMGSIAGSVMEGKRNREIAQEDPDGYMRHYRGIQALRHALQRHRRQAPEVLIFYGTTGAGKSCEAARMFPSAYHAPWPVGGRWWWPGYENEETVILDEFRHQIKLDVMLRLLDRHPLWVECKGDNMKMTSSRLVITTNIAPHKWYPGVEENMSIAALRRRIEEFATIWKFRGRARQDENGEWIVRKETVALKPRNRYNFNVNRNFQ